MSNKYTNRGITFNGLLFIVFLILKLCNVINWSWWWVFAPIWMPIAIVIGAWIVVFIVGAIIVLIKYPHLLKKKDKNL
ncbi:MAG TPA: hypothetical protein P5513_04460 [Candidatus Diapherotrites archaeon]|nr:hypothetical protein [Candidatus Diapherotrites archaeon]